VPLVSFPSPCLKPMPHSSRSIFPIPPTQVAVRQSTFFFLCRLYHRYTFATFNDESIFSFWFHVKLKPMPPLVQSSSLTELYVKLGFSENDFPGREQKKIVAELRDCPLDSLSRGNPFPFHARDSQEAKDLAIEFCEKGQRAERLWPPNSRGDWPTWSDEEGRSTCVIAQEYTSYDN